MAMVDISGKPEVFREATATGTIKLKPETIRLINEGKLRKVTRFTQPRLRGF